MNLSVPAASLAVTLAVLCPATATATARPLPTGFFGVVSQGPLATRDFVRMQGSIESLRVSFAWSEAEPRPGHFDFDSFDEVIGQAADHGIRVRPFIDSSPLWLTGDGERPPQGTARGRRAWRAFLHRLVCRYGPAGFFWRGRRRRLPIRTWQIWNEPNFLLAWHPRISPRGYVRLLGIAARAIRRVDPEARIVAAAVAPVEGGMLPWRFVTAMYRVPGASRDFDIMAANPYASSVAGVEYEIRRIRRAMAVAGDARKPLLVTELGVASDGVIANPFDKGRQGQARFLNAAYRRLIAKRRSWRIVGVDWFAWQDLGYADTHCVFCQYAGLFDIEGRPKPAWRALQSLTWAPLRGYGVR
jgi:hypothetical protein